MKIRFPWLTLTVAATALGLHFLPATSAVLQFDRPGLATGELWRGLTAHLVHFNASHLTWDLLMLVILGTWAEQSSRRGLAFSLAASAIAISTAVWFIQPELTIYRGLSGVDCALFGYVLVHFFLRALEQRDRQLVGVTLIVGVFFLAKTWFELTSGQTLFVQSGDAFIPVPLAHLAGLITGLCVRILLIRQARSPLGSSRPGKRSSKYSPREAHRKTNARVVQPRRNQSSNLRPDGRSGRVTVAGIKKAGSS